jgi:hypothetical protein
MPPKTCIARSITAVFAMIYRSSDLDSRDVARSLLPVSRIIPLLHRKRCYRLYINTGSFRFLDSKAALLKLLYFNK